MWNLFFEDAKRAINEFMYEETVYADDVNAYKIVPADTSIEVSMVSLGKVQEKIAYLGVR